MFERYRRKQPPLPGIRFSEWDAMVALTASVAWRSPASSLFFRRERAVTWAEYPYLHLLSEGDCSHSQNLSRPGRMFRLRSMSAEYIATNTHDVIDHYLLDGYLLSKQSTEFPADVNELSEELRRRVAVAMTFVLEMGLDRPEQRDEVDLAEIIRAAQLYDREEYLLA